ERRPARRAGVSRKQNAPESRGVSQSGSSSRMVSPYGSLPTPVTVATTHHRDARPVGFLYGSTFKALIHEEFGDGIMSAIDFDLDLARVPHEKATGSRS